MNMYRAEWDSFDDELHVDNSCSKARKKSSTMKPSTPPSPRFCRRNSCRLGRATAVPPAESERNEMESISFLSQQKKIGENFQTRQQLFVFLFVFIGIPFKTLAECLGKVAHALENPSWEYELSFMGLARQFENLAEGDRRPTEVIENAGNLGSNLMRMFGDGRVRGEYRRNRLLECSPSRLRR